MVGVAVENETEVTRLDPGPDRVCVELTGPAGGETIYARKVVLAGGRDGSGAPYKPAFPSLPRESRADGDRVFHSSDSIDFARFKGGRIGVLGASASAFDNAAVALESGAAEAHLFVRRRHLPQVNKSKWTVFPGFFHGYRDLDDATRWRIYTYIFAEAVPPPHELVLRCDRHTGFAMHFAEAWLDVIPSTDGVTVVTAKARYSFDAVILATGFSVDLPRRPELAHFHDRISLWADHVTPREAELHPEAAQFPYLGPGFELIERTPGSVPGLSHIYCFNAGSTMSSCGSGRRHSRAGPWRQSAVVRNCQQLVRRQRPCAAIGATCPRRSRAGADAVFPAEVKRPHARDGHHANPLLTRREFPPRGHGVSPPGTLPRAPCGWRVAER